MRLHLLRDGSEESSCPNDPELSKKGLAIINASLFSETKILRNHLSPAWHENSIFS
jgi:hypothetical protein